jgi:AAA ATPase domain
VAPEIVTAMVAELDARYGPAAAERMQDIVLRTGAAEVDTQVTEAGRRLVSAEFHSVGDSARAAVELARALCAATGEGPTAETVPGLRMALCTGPHRPRDDDPQPGPSPRVEASALVERAEPGQILATATTAIVTGGGLPPGVDLVDRGSCSLGPGRAPERIYELRIGSLDGGGRQDGGAGDCPGDGSVAPSNLEWARRAVGGVDNTVHDLGPVMHRLTTSWRTAIAGKRHTVLLSGEGRSCKTRVAAEVALRLHAEGALVLYGRWDRDATAPYQGIREAFGVYADGCSVEQLRADLEGRGDEIAPLLPDVVARIEGPSTGRPGTVADRDTGRARLFDAVEAWIAALGRRRPTLLVLDDVDWAERSSLLFVDHLHHASAGIPLLLLVTVGGDGDAGEPTVGSPGDHGVLAHAAAGEVERVDIDD